MLNFIYNILEAIVSLVLRFWLPPLKVQGITLEMIPRTDDDLKTSAYYRCRMTIINKSRDAIYTEKISLTVNEDNTFRIRDGSDRFRIDDTQPLEKELSFPIAENDNAIIEGRFTIRITITSGKTIKTHGCFPLDYNASDS